MRSGLQLLARSVLPLAVAGLSAAYLFAVSVDVAKPYVRDAFNGTTPFDGSIARAFEGTFERMSPYGNSVREAVSLTRFTLLSETYPGAVAGSGGWLFHRADFLVPDDFSRDLELALARIETVSGYLEGLGVKLVFIPLPMKSDLGRDHHAHDVAADRAERLYHQLLERVAASGIQTVDARAALKSRMEQVPVSFPSDQHWTPAGSQAVANAVAEAIGQTGRDIYVPAPTQQGSFQGDLSSFIGTARTAARAGIVEERFSKVGATLRPGMAEPDARIAIVGTSATADVRWGFVEHLELALQQPVADHSVSNKGPVFPVQNFAAHLASGAEKPEVVLWEFPLNAIFIPGQVDYEFSL